MVGKWSVVLRAPDASALGASDATTLKASDATTSRVKVEDAFRLFGESRIVLQSGVHRGVVECIAVS